jgi:molybdate transport system substrate-binding protein
MKIFFSLVVLLTTSALFPTGALAQEPKVATREIVVAAAADLKFALDEIIEEFHKEHPGTKVNASYGSSGNLFAQIDNGAPFDLFLSADIDFPKKLVERKKAVVDSLFSYAVGQIVIWVPNDSPIDVQQLGMQALLAPSVHKIAIANPEHAPYGRAAVAAMKKLRVYDQVAGKLVLGENIAQAAQIVESRAADIGVIALSLAVSPKMKAAGRYWEVPLDAYPRLDQGGVILSATKQPELARQFRGMLISPEGRETLRRYGFIMPG